MRHGGRTRACSTVPAGLATWHIIPPAMPSGTATDIICVGCAAACTGCTGGVADDCSTGAWPLSAATEPGVLPRFSSIHSLIRPRHFQAARADADQRAARHAVSRALPGAVELSMPLRGH